MTIRQASLFPVFASIVLASAPARAETPYTILATPAVSASEGTPARFKPVRSPNTIAGSPVCKLEIWPEGAAHGAVWTGSPDPGCMREEAVSLPAGRYVVKLGVSWHVAKSSQTGTTESPYQITSAVNKLQMTKCDFSPARPMVGRAASVSWEIRSGAPGPLGPFRVSILAGHQPVDSFTVDAIGAGASFSRTVPWTPPAAGSFRVECAVDPENLIHEDAAQRKDNTMFNQVSVVRPEMLKPLVVLGTLRLGLLGWSQDYTVCNVDLDASYRVALTGCARPCVGGYDGVPSRDFTANRVSVDGSLSPGCPGGLVSRAAFKPGTAEGPRNHYEDKTYTLKITASKDGASADSGPVSLRVPQYCGLISVPICVENETPKR